MRSGDYLTVIGCSSREGRVGEGDVVVVRAAVDRKCPVLQDTQETVQPLSTTELTTADVKLHTDKY